MSKRFKLMKRALAVGCALVAITALFWLFLSWQVVPRAQIALLVNGYVETSYQNGHAQYAFVKAAPKDWKPLDAISKKARLAIVAAEDSRFYRHFGFDLPEIRHALVEAVREGKRPRGASTISQQVAKNLFLSGEYSVWRKVKELAIALQLEHELSKDEILEIYLNTIEYGEGLYGITAASKHYFDKDPAQLTPKEGAFLATLLPNPIQHEQDLRERGLTPQTRETIAKILDLMRQSGYLSKEECKRQLEAPLTFTKEATTIAPS